MSAFILLIALVLALAAGYFFLQWKCPSKHEKLLEIVEKNELEGINVRKEDLSPSEIKEFKNQLSEEIKETKELTKKKSEELSEEEQQVVDSLPALQEIQGLVSEVQKKEDLSSKVYSYWDYGQASGIFIGAFVVSV